MTYKKITLIALLLIVMLTPFSTRAQSIDSNAALHKQISALLELIAALQLQLKEVQNKKTTVVSDLDIGRKASLDFDGEFTAKYPVKGVRLMKLGEYHTEVNDETRTWDLFIHLFGENFVRTYMNEFKTYDNAETAVAAFVFPKTNADRSWSLSINMDDVSYDTKNSIEHVMFILIHEFAHLMTMNNDVAKIYFEEEDCHAYYHEPICIFKGSLLDKFIFGFWSEADREYVKEKEELKEDSEKLSALKEFYRENRDNFVTEYAATNPIEDFAETFAWFVFFEKPTGSSVWEQKILYFYQNSESMKLRNSIREKIFSYLDDNT